jgi:hypothetical protein
MIGRIYHGIEIRSSVSERARVLRDLDVIHGHGGAVVMRIEQTLKPPSQSGQ